MGGCCLTLCLLAAVWCVAGEAKSVPLRGLDVDFELKAQETNLETDHEETRLGAIWSDCGNKDDMSKIDNVTITPNPPTKKKPVTIDAWFTLKENITGGSLTAKLKYGFLPLSQTISLCKLGDFAGVKCPIPKTMDHVHITQKIPSFIPNGHITGRVTAVDQNGKRIGCINIDVHIS